jgi:hypothetical protein
MGDRGDGNRQRERRARVEEGEQLEQQQYHVMCVIWHPAPSSSLQNRTPPILTKTKV